MSNAPQARLAAIEDAGDIARIFNQGIADRSATFEVEMQTETAVVKRLRDESARFPAVVVERGGGVVGFAWATAYRPRACYDGVAECSVYVDRGARANGVGRLALTTLIGEAERRGFWKLVSRIFPENLASCRLCASAGFREVGLYRRHGKLDGHWKDCVIVERLVGEAAQGQSTRG